jgi:glycosyltransferase involved in cell wall biosynthesis
LDVLLRAVAVLRRRGVEARVLLVGDGPMREELMRLTAELGLTEYVEFTGAVGHDDVPAMLRRMDIFAIPSTWEGFGVAALEASAMGLPVVGSNIHGLPDVVLDGETGVLVPAGDTSKLADAIARLAEDSGLRARMGEAGRAFVVEEYRWEDNARLMETLYDQLTVAATGSRS